MRFTDFLRDIGRPVVFYPSLNKVVGGMAANILLNQLLYWHGKGDDPDGWIYKSRVEILRETGLGRDSQETARRELRTRGFLQEKFREMPRRLLFRLHLDAINNAWEEAIHQHKVEIQPTEEAACLLHKVENPPSIRWKSTHHKVENPPAYTESTTESTTEKETETDPPIAPLTTAPRKKGQGRPKTPEHPIPPDYTPTDQVRQSIIDKYPGAQVDRLVDAMKNWAEGKGITRCSWDATLRTIAQRDWKERGSPEADPRGKRIVKFVE